MDSCADDMHSEAPQKATLTSEQKTQVADAKEFFESAYPGANGRIVEIEVVKVNGQLGYKFYFDSKAINKGSERGVTMVGVHELFHINNIDNKGVDLSSNNAMNNRDHADMVSDPEYLDWLKVLVPGKDDEYYENLRYAGTIGSPVFDDLDEKRQRELKKFFRNNKIYYK